MAINKKVSIKRAILLAMENMNMKSDSLKPIFIEYAIDAERRIGAFESYKRNIRCFKVCNRRTAELRCSTVAVMGLVGCTNNVDDAECSVIYGKYSQYYGRYTATSGTLDSTLYQLINGNTANMSPIRYEIQDNEIVFLSPIENEYVLAMVLEYQEDSEGFPMINEHHVPAIAEYIIWQYMKTLRFVPSKNLFNGRDRQEQEMSWHKECAKAKSFGHPPTETDWADIVNMYNDPLSGMNQAVWRYSDEYYSNTNMI